MSFRGYGPRGQAVYGLRVLVLQKAKGTTNYICWGVKINSSSSFTQRHKTLTQNALCNPSAVGARHGSPRSYHHHPRMELPVPCLQREFTSRHGAPTSNRVSTRKGAEQQNSLIVDAPQEKQETRVFTIILQPLLENTAARFRLSIRTHAGVVQQSPTFAVPSVRVAPSQQPIL